MSEQDWHHGLKTSCGVLILGEVFDDRPPATVVYQWLAVLYSPPPTVALRVEALLA